MALWEYAEITWNSGGRGSHWYGPDGSSAPRPEQGLELLRIASLEGWEVVSYSSAIDTPRAGHGQLGRCCLLRRQRG